MTIGTLSTVNTYFIPPLVCRFKQRFPNVQLHVQTEPSSQVRADVLARRFDMGFCHLPVRSDRLAITPLFDETLCLVARADFTSARTRMRLRDLPAWPLILMPLDYCLRKMIEGEYSKTGLTPNVTAEMTSPEGILEAVRAGAGLSILPEFYVRGRLKEGGLKLIQLIDPKPRFPVALISLAGRHQDLATREFVRLCRAIVTEIRSEGDLPGEVGSSA